MSLLFDLDETKLPEQLGKIFEGAELEIQKAEALFDLEGARLEIIARNVPLHQSHYDQKAQELKAVMKWLENYKAGLEAQHFKTYSRGARALSTTDQKTLMGGEKDIIETNQLIIAATQLYGKLDSIAEGFRQMGWMVGNITKLRVAELQDIIV